jgi:hypothetical protein
MGIWIDFSLCRTFGAHFDAIHNPDLTVGPISFRPYGPNVRYYKSASVLQQPVPGVPAAVVIFGAEICLV